MTNCKTSNLLTKVGLFIEITEANDYKKANLVTYQQLIWKLMYLVFNIKLNIIFIIGKLSRHNINSQQGHFQVAKRVVCYFIKMMQLRLIYG